MMQLRAEPVPVPSCGVIINRSGKYRYVYHVLRSYRDENGRPTNDRVTIGTLVPESDSMMIPNDRYYQYYSTNTDLVVPPARLQFHDFKSIGASFLVYQILQHLGVSRILNDVLGPLRTQFALTIATYMVCRGNVIDYIENWCDSYSLNPIITPQKAHLFFPSITFKEKMAFFKAWLDLNDTGGYLAYDVTSFSTYAKNITDSEFGFNRDGEKLPQINLGCYHAFQSKLPIFYVTYPGSIVDKSNMPHIMKYNKELNIKDIIFIMDRGFCSTSNLEWLHSQHIPYVMAVETGHKTTQAAIDLVRDNIDTYQYRCTESVYGRMIHSRFYGVTTNMHVFYSPELHEHKRWDLYRLIDSQKQTLEQITKMTPKQAKRYKRFYDITIGPNGDVTFSVNYDKIAKEEEYCGFFCICSNTDFKTSKILEIYKRKDLIEKGFDDIKNHIDMKRLRTHNDDTTNGKLFCAFIALIASSIITDKLHIMNLAGGKRRLSKRSLVSELEKIKVVLLSDGHHLMNALTKKQRDILDAFGFDEATLRSYALCS
jgi:transposase